MEDFFISVIFHSFFSFLPLILTSPSHHSLFFLSFSYLFPFLYPSRSIQEQAVAAGSFLYASMFYYSCPALFFHSYSIYSSILFSYLLHSYLALETKIPELAAVRYLLYLLFVLFLLFLFSLSLSENVRFWRQQTVIICQYCFDAII